MKAFVDDTLLGTDEAHSLPNPVDPKDQVAEQAFMRHIRKLRRLLRLNIEAGLKFKISKCHFARLITSTLGFVIGRGVKSLDPSKVAAVVAWPRPSRLGDTGRFLGFAGFLQANCSTDFSTCSRPLRGLQKAQLQKLGDLKFWKKRLESCLDAVDVISDGEETSLVPEICVAANVVVNDNMVLRSGTIPWSIAREKAFRQLKRLIVRAVDLNIPDTAGARSGVFPFFVLPGACTYAVGAGLFQFGPRETAVSLESNMRKEDLSHLELRNRAAAKRSRRIFGRSSDVVQMWIKSQIVNLIALSMEGATGVIYVSGTIKKGCELPEVKRREDSDDWAVSLCTRAAYLLRMNIGVDGLQALTLPAGQGTDGVGGVLIVVTVEFRGEDRPPFRLVDISLVRGNLAKGKHQVWLDTA